MSMNKKKRIAGMIGILILVVIISGIILIRNRKEEKKEYDIYTIVTERPGELQGIIDNSPEIFKYLNDRDAYFFDEAYGELIVIGEINEADFSLICRIYGIVVLDLSEAYYVDSYMTDRFGVEITTRRQDLNEIYMPQGEYGIRNEFFSYITSLKYVDMRYVDEAGYYLFRSWGSGVTTVVYSWKANFVREHFIDADELRKLIIYDMEEVGIWEIPEGIKEIEIVGENPPEFTSEAQIYHSKGVTIIYPNTKNWDEFMKELREYGFEGKLRRK